MAVYNTDKLLNFLSTHTENHLQKAVSEWQTLAPIIFSLQPLPGKWSATQCLAHLNSYGRYYLPQIERSMKITGKGETQGPDKFTAGWLGNYFTKTMLTDATGKPSKRMSSPKYHDPLASLDSRQVIAEFIEQQELLLDLLGKATAFNLNNARVPISIAKFIKLKLGDTFLFLIAHNYRHLMQAVRALEMQGVGGRKLTGFELGDAVL